MQAPTQANPNLHSWLKDSHIEPTEQGPIEPNLPIETPSFFDDTKVAAIIAIISTVVSAIFRYPSLATFTACAIFHLLTKVAKKLFEDYTVTDDIERLGLVLVQELPYLHLI